MRDEWGPGLRSTEFAGINWCGVIPWLSQKKPDEGHPATIIASMHRHNVVYSTKESFKPPFCTCFCTAIGVAIDSEGMLNNRSRG
jgi:hypothetical protein